MQDEDVAMFDHLVGYALVGRHHSPNWSKCSAC
jgi:hypothetical protein